MLKNIYIKKDDNQTGDIMPLEFQSIVTLNSKVTVMAAFGAISSPEFHLINDEYASVIDTEADKEFLEFLDSWCINYRLVA